MTKALFLLFLLPFLSHLLLNVVVSTSGNGGPPDIQLPAGTNPAEPKNGKLRREPLRFYWHDILLGPDASVVEVAHGTTDSSTHFGTIKVMDDLLTAGPDRSSQVIGKSQGIYVYADRNSFGLFMAMTLTFTAGEYAGSSLTVVGRNDVLLPEREMPITGGTGLLQYAKGYVRVRTTSFEPTKFYFVVEYTCYFNTSPYHISSPGTAE